MYINVYTADIHVYRAAERAQHRSSAGDFSRTAVDCNCGGFHQAADMHGDRFGRPVVAGAREPNREETAAADR